MRFTSVFVLVSLCLGLSAGAGEKLVADGETVVFLGDSITHYGANHYNKALFALADGERIRVLDQLAIINGELSRRAANKKASYCSAGYPLNANVNLLVGKALLPYLGFSEKEIAQTVSRLEALPDFADLEAVTSVSFAEYDRLLGYAKKDNVPLADIVTRALVGGAQDVTR